MVAPGAQAGAACSHLRHDVGGDAVGEALRVGVLVRGEAADRHGARRRDEGGPEAHAGGDHGHRRFGVSECLQVAVRLV